jgi:hypothetical protein
MNMVRNPFTEIKDEPGFWILSARRLKRSGDLIFQAYSNDLEAMVNGATPTELENLELAGVASMLFGLAIENLLKAIIISNDKSDQPPDRVRDWDRDGHELVSLAEKADINLNEKQRDLLVRLTSSVRWSGKYPVSKKKG